MTAKPTVSQKSRKDKRNVAPENIVIPSKICSHCFKVKPLSEFHKNRTMQDGYESKCKTCVHFYYAQWYENNRERVAITNKAWRKAHPAQVSSNSKKTGGPDHV